MKMTYRFDPQDITKFSLDGFQAFLAEHVANGSEPAPGSLSVLAPRRPGAETLGLYDPQIRQLYAALAARYPRLPRWVAAGRFTRELVISGISDLQVRWDHQEDCPHYSYSGPGEAARWAEIEALAFPEIVAGGVATPEIEEQWRDLHREF